ncbi:MAG: hydrogenase/urease maturation nickel metallochaperone HypA [Gammaproteobacteria bacterium]|jgi:hydrogenase nickel incorporation protein HypA/HybF
MHEASLIGDLIAKVATLAEAQDAHKVTRVSVWLGALSHLSPEHFRQHFATDASGTIADGAELEIETSDDIGDPNAEALLLRSIEVET